MRSERERQEEGARLRFRAGDRCCEAAQGLRPRTLMRKAGIVNAINGSAGTELHEHRSRRHGRRGSRAGSPRPPRPRQLVISGDPFPSRNREDLGISKQDGIPCCPYDTRPAPRFAEHVCFLVPGYSASISPPCAEVCGLGVRYFGWVWVSDGRVPRIRQHGRPGRQRHVLRLPQLVTPTA